MKRTKLAVVALLLGISSFINLFGLEKGIMAIIAGALAIRELTETRQTGGKVMAWLGIVLGALSMVTVIFILLWKGPQLLEYFKRLPRFH
jgi:uncharacterized membrane protein